MTTSSLVATGSVLDHAKRMNADLATSFLDVQLILLCDRSDSMYAQDVQVAEFGAKTKARYEAEDELVKHLQKKHEGKILLASFSNVGVIHLNGVLPSPDGGTQMLKGLQKVLPYATDDVKVILLSDGQPSDSEDKIINFAVVHLMGRLDTMYCGPRGAEGEKFLERLAKACMGQSATNVLNNPTLLTSRVNFLLSAGA